MTVLACKLSCSPAKKKKNVLKKAWNLSCGLYRCLQKLIIHYGIIRKPTKPQNENGSPKTKLEIKFLYQPNRKTQKAPEIYDTRERYQPPKKTFIQNRIYSKFPDKYSITKSGFTQSRSFYYRCYPEYINTQECDTSKQPKSHLF